MKSPLLAIVLFGILLGRVQAQAWDAYQVSVKGDTINCVDHKKMKQGKWVVHQDPLRGEPGYEEEGIFSDDKKEGPWRKYNLTGDLLGVENYKWGFRDGKQTYFTPMGDLLREESWRAVNPENPYDTIEVPDLNNPMVMTTKIVKQDVSELRHGPWKFYDPSTGMILKTENYSYGMKLDALGRPVSTDKTGSASTTQATATDKSAQKPKQVEDWEKKNSGKKKMVVRDGRTGGS